MTKFTILLFAIRAKACGRGKTRTCQNKKLPTLDLTPFDKCIRSLIDEGEMSRLLGEENSWQRKMSLSFDSSFPSSSVTPTSFSHVTMIPVEPNPPNFANNSSAVPIHSPHAVSLPNSKGSPAPQQQASPGNSQPLAPTKSTGPSTSAPARSTAPFLPTQSMKPVSFAPFSPPNNTAIPVMDSAPPNFANAGSSAPSFAPGRTPTISPEMFDSDPPSIVPNTNMSPTQAQNNSILTCTDVGSVGLAETPGEARTTLTFKVGYLVESFESLTDFIDDIEKRIVLTAVLGALQCNTSGLLTNGTTDSDELFSGVVITTNGRGDNCTSEISVCTVLETEFTVYVSNEVDPEVGAFLGFVMLRQEMDNGSFESSTIDRCQYLSPLPLLPPIIEKEKTSGADSFPDVQSEDNISVSPWTLGAVLAMCTFRIIDYMIFPMMTTNLTNSSSPVHSLCSCRGASGSCGMVTKPNKSKPSPHAID